MKILIIIIQWVTTVIPNRYFFRNSKLFRKYFKALKFLNFQKPLNLLIKISNGHTFFEKNYIFEVSISKNKNQFRRTRTVVTHWIIIIIYFKNPKIFLNKKTSIYEIFSGTTFKYMFLKTNYECYYQD